MFKGFKFFLIDYFTFSRKERISIIVLVSLLILIIAGIYFVRFYYKEPPIDFTSFKNEIATFEKQFSEDSVSNNFTYYDSTDTREEEDFENFSFNPNDLPDSLWEKLGINGRTIRTIKNYEAKGGKFFKKEDVKKIYGFDEKDYTRLESFIVIPPRENKIAAVDSSGKTQAKYEKPETLKVILDINSATAEDLKTLYGIGDYKANSIIKYREFLGGYINKEQLREAYGIDSLIYEEIKDKVEVKTQMRILININSHNELDFKHPYISKQFARLIINYRKMHGDYKTVDELKNLDAIDEKLFEKIKPYLSVK